MDGEVSKDEIWEIFSEQGKDEENVGDNGNVRRWRDRKEGRMKMKWKLTDILHCEGRWRRGELGSGRGGECRN